MEQVKRELVRVHPLNLRGEEESYSFYCVKPDCDGKSPGQPLPEGCHLPRSAQLLASVSLDNETIRSRLVDAQCVKVVRSVRE